MEQKLIARDRECSMLRDCMNYDFSFVGSHRSTQRVQLRNFGKAMKQYAGLKTVPKYADWFVTFDNYLRKKKEQIIIKIDGN